MRTLFTRPPRFTFGLAFAMLAILPGCSRKPSTAYQGYVESNFVYVASPQAGRLTHLAVGRGDNVSVTQPLFSLDDEPEAAATRQSAHLLRASEAHLADMRTGKRPPEVAVIQAELEQAIAERTKVVEILKSLEAQYAAGGVSLTDLIGARAAVDANAATVRQVQSELLVAKLPDRDEQLRAQTEQVAADRAALDQASWRLRQKAIGSPREGIVFDTLYREGEWVAAGNPVVQVLAPEDIEVRFFVPETLVGQLKVGQGIRVHCDGCASELATTITFISTKCEYTPPIIYSNENRAKLVFLVIAKPAVEQAAALHPGQPLEVTLP